MVNKDIHLVAVSHALSAHAAGGAENLRDAGAPSPGDGGVTDP